MIQITSPLGNPCHYADQKESGTFAFTANEDGDYMACFWVAKHNPPTTLTVDFEWRSGLAAKDWSKVAKRGQLEIMELDLKKLFDTIAIMHDEMYYLLPEREESMQILIRSTNSKMAMFSFFSLIVCLAVASMQLWHLKTFFEKKLI